jgi:hypothetical protein
MERIENAKLPAEDPAEAAANQEQAAAAPEDAEESMEDRVILTQNKRPAAYRTAGRSVCRLSSSR